MYARRPQQHDVPPVGVVHNVKPLGRAARLKTREAMEKEAIKARIGGFVRHGDEIDRPLSAVESSAQYMSEMERFRTDSSIELKAAREQFRMKEEARIDVIREQTKARDEQRFRTLQDEAERALSRMNLERQYDQNIQNSRATPGLRGFAPSVPYNPITLKLGDTPAAELLQVEDNKVLHRANLRNRRLFEKQNQNMYNLITGTNISQSQAPDRPLTPEKFRARTPNSGGMGGHGGGMAAVLGGGNMGGGHGNVGGGRISRGGMSYSDEM